MGTTIRGIHHVTAITSSAPKIWDFFTNQLGLHLIKKLLTKMTSIPITYIFQMIKAKQGVF